MMLTVAARDYICCILVATKARFAIFSFNHAPLKILALARPGSAIVKHLTFNRWKNLQPTYKDFWSYKL